jgi:L-malate glycosyltransferase
MACEVVPIATNEGGVPEVIDHGKTGFLAAVGDVDTMANYAIDILSDEAKLKQMGEQARASAQAKFCASKIIPLYEKHYREVLDRSS